MAALEAKLAFWRKRNRVVMSSDEAREGPLGRKVLYVLITSLVLVGLAWMVLELAY